MFHTLDEMHRAHEGMGGHWFDEEAQRFFKCKLYPNEVRVGEGATWFISSERDTWGHNPRMYTIRRFDHGTYNVHTEGEFQQYATLKEARAALREMGNG